VQSVEANKIQQIEFIDQILRQINDYNIEVLPLRSELDAANSSYRGLLQRIEQAQMAADEDASVVTIYQYARAPQVPDSPRKGLILFAVLVVGFGSGIVLALLQHLYEDIISTPYDIEVELKQNLIGLIPHVEEDPDDDTPLSRLTLSRTFSPLTEAFAGLRASVLVQGRGPREQGWVISVMSVSPQEGKTTVSCNLAISLAKTFKRILLIDGDMRRPRHHDVFNIPKKNHRLMEVLMKADAREVDFRGLPQLGPVDNMQVVLGHPVDGISPTEVLETGVFDRFIKWARSQYDIVIIDSPPLEAASDALIYGRYADDCILVCRQNRSRKGALRQAIRELKKNNCPLVGLIINDYQASSLSYGREYGGYGHYYGKYYATESATGRDEQ
jgi:capsular exopolysaccharide synthesis family protein